MIELPAVKLPQELTKLLQSYSLLDNSKNRSIELLIKKSSSLTLLIEKTFRTTHPHPNVGTLLNTLGPKNFRDRLASIYLQYYKNGYYPEETNLNYINHILQEENSYAPYTMSGHSRIFLLFFYLDMVKTNISSSHINNEVPDKIPASIRNYLKFSKQKIKEIDYILLIFLHYHHFLGEEKLSSFFSYLSPFRSFSVLWRLITDDQKKIMMKNIVHYSYSINDETLFQIYS